MLSGLDMQIVAVCVEGCEILCLPCAAKRLGEPRCAFVIAGLEHLSTWGAPQPESRYEIDDTALDNGYECQCWASEGHRRKSRDEFCERCGEVCCHDCGKRLDERSEAAA